MTAYSNNPRAASGKLSTAAPADDSRLTRRDIQFLADSASGHRAFRASTDSEVDRLVGTGVLFQRQVVKVTELLLDAPNRSLTARELAAVVPQYNARIFSIRRAGIPLPSRKNGDGPPYFQLAVTDEQALQIRRAIELASKVNAKDRKKIMAQVEAQAVETKSASQQSLFAPPAPSWADPETRRGGRR